MVKVKVKTRTNEVVCDSCGAELCYDSNDVYNGLFGAEGVDCTECGEFVFIDSDKPRIPPKFPDTFYHKEPKDISCKLTNEEVQELVDQVITHKNELKPGEFAMCSTGDTMVCLFKYENETDVVVSKNNWEDSFEN